MAKCSQQSLRKMFSYSASFEKIFLHLAHSRFFKIAAQESFPIFRDIYCLVKLQFKCALTQSQISERIFYFKLCLKGIWFEPQKCIYLILFYGTKYLRWFRASFADTVIICKVTTQKYKSTSNNNGRNFCYKA